MGLTMSCFVSNIMLQQELVLHSPTMLHDTSLFLLQFCRAHMQPHTPGTPAQQQNIVATLGSCSSGPTQALLALGMEFAPYHLSKTQHAKAGTGIANNPLQPHFAAKDWLQLWTLPFAKRAYKDTTAALFPLVSSQLLKVLLAFPDRAMRSMYAVGLLQFHQFSDKLSVSEEARMLALQVLPSAFAAFSVGKVSGRTIVNWLTSLHAWHHIHPTPWNSSKT
jgi:hypothetical protein